MTPYATVQDCIDRLGSEAVLLLADAKGADPPAYEALETALVDAAAEIDAYVGARHEVPLDPVPVLAKRLSVDIAAYRRSPSAGPATKEREKRYEDAVRLLRDVADGKVSLGARDPDPPAESDGAAVSIEAAPRVMTRTGLRGIL